MPAGSRATLGAEPDLGWQLATLSRAFLARAEPIFQGLPHGPRGYQVLRAAGGGDATQVEMGRRLGIDKSVMVGLLDDLAAAGLVCRQTHPTDRRARLIVLTESGRALAGRIEAAVAAFEDEVLAPLTAREQSALRRSLGTVVAHLAEPDGACPTATGPACATDGLPRR